ncbi:hypothetical protein Tco_0710056, partial [Tanacetum coccineum]
PKHNKDNTSSKVEPNIISPIQSHGDFEFLIEDSKADLQDLKPSHPDLQPEVTQNEEPISTEHPSTTPEASQPKSSKKYKKARKPKDSEPSPDPSISESSSASISFKDYDNYMPRTKRENWAKHEEVVASYANLGDELEAFNNEAYEAQGNTDTSLRNYEITLLAFKVQEAVKDDPTLNAKVLAVIDAYIKNSLNLTKLNLHMKEVIKRYQQSSNNLLSLVELLREANVPGLMHTLEAI